MVSPEIATVAAISNTLEELFPLITRVEAPGPLIIRSWLIKSSPLVSVMIAGKVIWAKLIVSPGEAFAIASRSEPGPLSDVLVTVMVLPKTDTALKPASIISPTVMALSLQECKRLFAILSGFIVFLLAFCGSSVGWSPYTAAH